MGLEVTPDEPEVKISLKVGTEATFEAIDKDEEPKPRKRRKKIADGTEIVTNEPDLPMLQSNVPYIETFQETTNILRTAIMEVDRASAEVTEDINSIRSSKTDRNKYTHLSNMQMTRSQLINTKIAAAKEMNNSIKTAADLDLKRAKEQKLSMAEKDDTRSIQEEYNAFVSMPVSQNINGQQQFMNPLGIATGQLTARNDNLLVAMFNQNPDAGYENYLNNMSPAAMTMFMEENPHINEVVAMNPATGQAEFAIYDDQTGKFIPNMPTKNNQMYMPGMTFDTMMGEAHSNDLNESFKIINVDTLPSEMQGVPNMVGRASEGMEKY